MNRHDLKTLVDRLSKEKNELSEVIARLKDEREAQRVTLQKTNCDLQQMRDHISVVKQGVKDALNRGKCDANGAIRNSRGAGAEAALLLIAGIDHALEYVK